MLLRITDNLYIGNNESLIFTNTRDWVIIHACQLYHYKLLGWSTFNRPKKDDKNYLIYETPNEISLNWVDGGSHLYDWFGVERFNHLLDIIDTGRKTKKILIHCDLGHSRSPSLALLYLAKRTNLICNTTFTQAYMGFVKLYPQYRPGGILNYIETHWGQFK